MKQVFTLPLLLLSFFAFGQTPQGVSYQAVATDVQGEPLENQTIGVRFSILQGSASGQPVYVEHHNTSTDPYGMFNLSIGLGTVVGGEASELGQIDWGAHSFFLKVDLDVSQTDNYETIGTQQLLSVPYALFAANCGTANNDNDQDPTNEIQSLSLEGDTLKLSNGGSVVLMSSETSPNSTPAGISVECVEMGFSPLCGGIGLTDNVQLGPSDGAYHYQISAQNQPNADFLFSAPHWRKFQIHGLSSDYSGKIYVRWQTSYTSGDDYFRHSINSLDPETDGEGGVFIYFWSYTSASSQQCIQDGVQLSVPVASGMNVNGGSYYNYEHFEIGYSNGNCLLFTGAMIDF